MEAVAAGMADGQRSRSPGQAVARFGSARTVARRFAHVQHRRVPGVVLGHLVLGAVWLGGIGLCAVGLSGLLARGMGAAWGVSSVAGDQPGVTYTSARCAGFFEYHARALSCAQAAAAHHFDEVVLYRVAVGALGLLVLLAAWLVRSRLRRRDALTPLPDGFVATIGTTLFGLAGALLLVQGVDQAILGNQGWGQYLSGAIASVMVAIAFLRSLYRTLVYHSSLGSPPPLEAAT